MTITARDVIAGVLIENGGSDPETAIGAAIIILAELAQAGFAVVGVTPDKRDSAEPQSEVSA